MGKTPNTLQAEWAGLSERLPPAWITATGRRGGRRWGVGEKKEWARRSNAAEVGGVVPAATTGGTEEKCEVGWEIGAVSPTELAHARFHPPRRHPAVWVWPGCAGTICRRNGAILGPGGALGGRLEMP